MDGLNQFYRVQGFTSVLAYKNRPEAFPLDGLVAVRLLGLLAGVTERGEVWGLW
jgi:hypothetical protein